MVPPTRSGQTWPDIAHPKASFWAHGAPFGPFLKALTFINSSASSADKDLDLSVRIERGVLVRDLLKVRSIFSLSKCSSAK